MKIGRRAKWILLAFVLVVAGLSAGLIRALRQPLLSDYATRLPCPDANYVWQSPHEIVTFATSAASSAPGNGPGTPPQLKVNAVHTDITTGTQTVLSEFNALFPEHTPIDIAGWKTSPNGIWLAYRAQGPHDWTEPPFASLWELGGTRSFPAIEAHNYSAAAVPFSQTWLPDSRRYLIQYNAIAEKASLFSLDIPNGAGVSVPIPVGTQSLLGVTADYLLITSDFNRFAPGPLKKVSLYTQGLYPNTAPVHTFSINLPAGATLRELSLSPQGDRLLWTLSFTRRPALGVMLVRIFPSLAGQFQARTLTTLQISRLDGSQMRELGAEENPTGKNPEPVQTVRWLPDGKRISYRFQNALYTVPAHF